MTRQFVALSLHSLVLGQSLRVTLDLLSSWNVLVVSELLPLPPLLLHQLLSLARLLQAPADGVLSDTCSVK